MSQIHKFIGDSAHFDWKTVDGISLSEEGLQSVTRFILIGEKEKAPNSIMRYFRVEPKGHSKLERHPQEHQVIVLHGKGKVQIADVVTEIGPFDVVFVEGNELHQFSSSENEALGFICVIPK
jgi:quercetin dioxygenase-like cupin family protein